MLAWQMVLLPICIDYKPSTADFLFTTVYAVIVVLNMVGTATLTFRCGLSANRAFLLGIAIAALFVLSSIVGGLIDGQSLLKIVRGIPPVVLFLSGLVATSALMSGGYQPAWFWRQVLIAALIGTTVNLLLVVTLQNLTFDTVRYQVLGGFTPLVVAYSCGALLFGGWRVWSVALVTLNATLILFSVTRTQIVVAAGVLFGLVVFARERLVGLRNLPLAAVVLAGAVVLGVAVASVLPGNPLDRWASRLMVTEDTSGRIDITALTRTAEMTYQIERMKSEPVRAMLGFGIAAENRFDDVSARIIAQAIGVKNAYWTENGVGHNNYVGTLYVGGLVVGSAMIIFQVWAMLLGGILIRVLTHPSFAPYSSAIISAPLAIIAYLTFGALGGYFGSRSASLCLALSIGVTIWQMSRMKTATIDR